MNKLQILKNEQFGEVRTIQIENKTYFGATDSAKALGYVDATNAIKQHCKKDGVVKHHVIDSIGRTQLINFITEGNLYRLISKSQLPDAEKFESWIFDEMLPAIRKTGGYVNNDDLFINTYLPYVDENTKLIFRNTLGMVRKQNEIIALKDKVIDHKDEVIVGLVDEITLAEKRQVLNRVVKYRGANYQERWRELYKQFEMKYHLNLKSRVERYNLENKPKVASKIGYIDKVMNKIPELYEIACKLYENDVKELAAQIYEIA